MGTREGQSHPHLNLPPRGGKRFGSLATEQHGVFIESNSAADSIPLETTVVAPQIRSYPGTHHMATLDTQRPPDSVMVRVHEIALKGRNRPLFLQRLRRNLRLGAERHTGAARRPQASRSRDLTGAGLRLAGDRRADRPRFRRRQVLSLPKGAHARWRPSKPALEQRDRRPGLRHLPHHGQAVGQDVSTHLAGDQQPPRQRTWSA